MSLHIYIGSKNIWIDHTESAVTLKIVVLNQKLIEKTHFLVLTAKKSQFVIFDDVDGRVMA